MIISSMPALLVVGLALVGFGALMLLILPDRPGGKVAWHGFEVSSIGAGLPLIVTGVIAVAISAVAPSEPHAPRKVPSTPPVTPTANAHREVPSAPPASQPSHAPRKAPNTAPFT